MSLTKSLYKKNTGLLLIKFLLIEMRNKQLSQPLVLIKTKNKKYGINFQKTWQIK